MYTSNDYEEVLEKIGIKHSYSKKGYPYDNASMESFNAILKKEEVNLNTYKTFKEAKMVIDYLNDLSDGKEVNENIIKELIYY